MGLTTSGFVRKSGFSKFPNPEDSGLPKFQQQEKVLKIEGVVSLDLAKW